MTGILYIVSTPIGNLKDITLRAIETLKSVDFILCEDTRETQKLLNHYEIKKDLVSFTSHNEHKKTPQIIEKIKEGKNIALVSTRGTPCISDPGFFLIKSAVENNLKLIPIPGPSAFLTGLVASGFPTDDFIFLGFLKRKLGKLKVQIKEAFALNKTVIFYESPHRLKRTLEFLKEILPQETKVCIARELTKIFEEFIRGTIVQVTQKVSKDIKGEVVVVIGPVCHKKCKERYIQ